MNLILIFTKNAMIVRPKNIPKVIAPAIKTFSGFWYIEIEAIMQELNIVKSVRIMQFQGSFLTSILQVNKNNMMANEKANAIQNK